VSVSSGAGSPGSTWIKGVKWVVVVVVVVPDYRRFTAASLMGSIT